jgi:hypothetical protein
MKKEAPTLNNLKQIAPADIIKKNLSEINFGKLNPMNLNAFIEKTQIHNKLGNRCLSVEDVALAVDSKIFAYLDNLHEQKCNIIELKRHNQQTYSVSIEEYSTFIRSERELIIKKILEGSSIPKSHSIEKDSNDSPKKINYPHQSWWDLTDFWK